jgi:transposase
VRQRTALINSLRGQLAEFGLIAPKGVWSIPDLNALAQGATPAVLPDAVRSCVELIMGQIDDLQTRVQTIEKAIRVAHRASEVSMRLQTIPGIGVITASAITATIGDIKVFRSGRHLAAWIGLVPRQSGSGGKVHMGKISKKGDAYLRKLLVLGATAVIRYCRNKPQFAAWINALLQRRPARVVTIAVANKMARIAWAVMSRGETFRQEASAIA